MAQEQQHQQCARQRQWFGHSHRIGPLRPLAGTLWGPSWKRLGGWHIRTGTWFATAAQLQRRRLLASSTQDLADIGSTRIYTERLNNHGPFLGFDPAESDFQSAVGHIVAGRASGSVGESTPRDTTSATFVAQDARKEFRPRSRWRWPSGLNGRIVPGITGWSRGTKQRPSNR